MKGQDKFLSLLALLEGRVGIVLLERRLVPNHAIISVAVVRVRVLNIGCRIVARRLVVRGLVTKSVRKVIL